MAYLASLSDWLWRRQARDRRANTASRPVRPPSLVGEPALRIPLAVGNDRLSPTARLLTPRRLAVSPEPAPTTTEKRVAPEPPALTRAAAPRPGDGHAVEAEKPATPALAGEPRPRQFVPVAGPAAMRRRSGPSAEDINTILREAFTPTRPKQEGSHFAGRQRQIERIVAAIEEERAHVVIFGERGTGKTSLANVIGGLAAKSGYIVQRFACSSEVTFEDLFQNLLRGVPGRLAQAPRSASIAGAPPPAPSSLEAMLPQGAFGPAELLPVLARVSGRHLILMVDEYDRVQNEDTKNKLAEALKNMSDAGVPVMLVLIGVASDVDDLLGKHPSLRRALVTVPLPLMTRREVSTIIENGELRLGVPFEPDVKDAILDLAPGLPYYAQLLCLFTARSALRQGSESITFDDLHYAGRARSQSPSTICTTRSSAALRRRKPRSRRPTSWPSVAVPTSPPSMKSCFSRRPDAIATSSASSRRIMWRKPWRLRERGCRPCRPYSPSSRNLPGRRGAPFWSACPSGAASTTNSKRR